MSETVVTIGAPFVEYITGVILSFAFLACIMHSFAASSLNNQQKPPYKSKTVGLPREHLSLILHYVYAFYQRVKEPYDLDLLTKRRNLAVLLAVTEHVENSSAIEIVVLCYDILHRDQQTDSFDYLDENKEPKGTAIGTLVAFLKKHELDYALIYSVERINEQLFLQPLSERSDAALIVAEAVRGA